MPDTPNSQRDSLNRLHIISHLDWQREGYHTFEHQRAELLDTLARLTAAMQQTGDSDSPPLKHFLMGGQTIVLEDIAAVRANMVALLAIYNAGGRLTIGPWYVQTDSTLVSGEALVRNLLLGRMDVLRHGMKLMNVAFMPGISHHTAQMPQILRGFGIDAVVLSIDSPAASGPFRWIAPDESEVLVVNYQHGGSAAQAVAEQTEAQPEGPFLWLNDCNHGGDIVPNVAADVTVPLAQSTLMEYVRALHQSYPDGMRPALHGDIHLQDRQATGGRFSARMPIKQMNAELETWLIYRVEPLLTLALSHGKAAYPDNLRALLEYAWRRLLANQAQPVINGICTDSVYDEIQVRYRQVSDVAERLMEGAMNALPGTPLPLPAVQPAAEETYIVVWNSHSQPLRQVVELRLSLPEGLNPDVLLAPGGEEVAYSVENGVIIFRAKAPAVGFAVYTLRLSAQPIAHTRLKQVFYGVAIGSLNNETLSAQNGQIAWERGGIRFNDLLNFYSGGDAGDITRYRPPSTDIVIKAGMADVVEIEATPVYERLIFRHRMRLPAGLQNGKRERGVRVLELVTTATSYENTPGIHFRTAYSNIAGDHRLRAHFRTGLRADYVLVDAPYALLKRPLPKDGSSALQGIQSAVAVPGEAGTLALFTRGLPEIDPMKIDGQITLGLTLLRSTGWLNSEKRLAAPGAQHQHELTAEYMLIMLPPGDASTMLREAQNYRAPLQAYQYRQKPDDAQRSYLSLDDERILMTALKPPQEGKGWIVRLMNPLETEVTVTLTTQGKLVKARRTSMAELPQAELEVKGNQVEVMLTPAQIATLHLTFEEI